MSCGSSTILPNGQCSVLPITPTDGQVFIDQELVKWIFNAQADLWERAGTATVVPLADETTIGYLSSQDKSLLDQIPTAPGGFGIITDTKLLLQSDTNPDGVLSGDIKLVSESLDIVCVNSDGVKLNCSTPPDLECASAGGNVPGLAFKLSKKFLDTLIVNIPGQQGKPGHKGNKGPDGKPGFAGGPPGRTGILGQDITELCRLTGVRYNDIDGITDTAIVDLNTINDDSGCKLLVTTARLNVPGDVPAHKIIATPIDRNIVYDPDPDPALCDITRINQWRLVKNSADTTPLNVSLLRLAVGAEQSTTDAVGFNATLSLKKFVSDIVDEYQGRLAEIDKSYGKTAKEYIEKIDDKARTILSDLTNQLSLCEFNLPAVEYCITFTGCDQIVEPPPSPSVAAASKAGAAEAVLTKSSRKLSNVIMGKKKWNINT